MNITTSEKAHFEHEELEIKKDIAKSVMASDMDRWFSTKIGNDEINIDQIINDELLSHKDATLIVKLIITGHIEEAQKLTIDLYEELVTDAINEAVEDYYFAEG